MNPEPPKSYWKMLDEACRTRNPEFDRECAPRRKRKPESRRKWLRRMHAEPLDKRALAVLGEDGLPAWRRLRAALKANPGLLWDYSDGHSSDRALDFDLRRLLRRLAQLPEMARRDAYLRTLLRVNPDDEEANDDVIVKARDRYEKLVIELNELEKRQDNLSDDEFRELPRDECRKFITKLGEAQYAADKAKRELQEARSPFHRLAKRIGDKAAWSYFDKLCKAFRVSHQDSDRVGDHVARMMMNAANVKPYPKKYLDVVIQNEIKNGVSGKKHRSGKRVAAKRSG